MAREQFPLKELGATIKQAREQAGLSAAGLGQRVGVSTRTIERWENGDTMKVRDRLDRVAASLGLNEFDLVERAYQLAGLIPPTSQPTGAEVLTQMISELQDGQVEVGLRLARIEELLEASGSNQSPPGSSDGPDKS